MPYQRVIMHCQCVSKNRSALSYSRTLRRVAKSAKMNAVQNPLGNFKNEKYFTRAVTDFVMTHDILYVAIITNIIFAPNF